MWLRSRLLADSGLLRRRGAALALALAIELLLLLLLLFFVPPVPGRKDGSRTTVFGIEAPRGDDDQPEKSKAEKQQKKTERAQRAQARPQTQPPPPIPTPVETPVPVGPPTFLKLSRNDYQQGDIAKVPSRPATASSDAADSASADSGGGRGRGDTPTAGRKGRNGETLYVAEWVREPTNAELSPYINENRARFPGYGLIACRTVARNRVEDCYELEETRGTGFAGSVRQAAFQFLVRPPRVDNKLMVGEWVMIRIDYRRERREP